MTYEAAIAALADPSRRTIMECLRTGPMPVGELAEGLPISRPAVSQHLRVLSDAGLLTVKTEGTKRIYAISPDGVEALRTYLDELWSDALTAFVNHADRDRKGTKDER